MKLKTSYQFTAGSTARINVSVVNDDNCGTSPLDTPELMHKFWCNIIAEQPDYEPDKESVCVILLNCRFMPYAWHRVSLGTVCESSAHPREIFRPVIVGGAHSFVLAHNHPSGDPSPSIADASITRRILEAANIMQIQFADHVIIGKPAPGRTPYFSFREAGIIG